MRRNILIFVNYIIIFKIDMTSVKSKNSVYSKDKNNNLNEKECLEFVRLYGSGNFKSILNPKTKKILSSLERIEFIYNKCINNQKKPIITGNVSVAASSNTEDDYNKIFSKLNLKDIFKILESPINNDNSISIITTKIFGNDERVNILKLNKYLKKSENDLVNFYKKCVIEIKKYINGFDPFMDNKIFEKNVEDRYRSHDDGTNNDTYTYIPEIDEIYDKPIQYFKEAVLYSSRNKTSKEFIDNLKNNYVKFYAIKYMVKLLDEYALIASRILSYEPLEILNVLLDGNKIMITDGSISLDTSLSYSESPTGATTEVLSHKQGKIEYLKYIMNTNGFYGDSINDADPYTQDRWDEMPLKKLKYVIKIPYSIDDKTYCIAYYAKSLYKAWNIAVKEKKEFINPITRMVFTDSDKGLIMKKMIEMYPHITPPKKKYKNRKDLVFFHIEDYITYNGDEIDTICLYIKYKIKNTISLIQKDHTFVNLISIHVPLKFASENDYIDEADSDYIPEEYSFGILLYNFERLFITNKLIGKSIPFKMHHAIEKYNNKILINKKDYLDFFNMLL